MQLQRLRRTMSMQMLLQHLSAGGSRRSAQLQWLYRPTSRQLQRRKHPTRRQVQLQRRKRPTSNQRTPHPTSSQDCHLLTGSWRRLTYASWWKRCWQTPLLRRLMMFSQSLQRLMASGLQHQVVVRGLLLFVSAFTAKKPSSPRMVSRGIQRRANRSLRPMSQRLQSPLRLRQQMQHRPSAFASTRNPSRQVSLSLSWTHH